MTEEEWLQTRNAADLIRYARSNLKGRRGSIGRRLRLAACSYFRANWSELPDEMVRHAVEIAEAFADKQAGVIELIQAERSVSGSIGVDQSVYRFGCFALLHPQYARTISLIGFGPDYEHLCPWIRDIFGNPFRPISFDPSWRTSTAVAIAQSMYDSRDFGPMPLLADALQDAGCEVPEIIDHCRGPGPHVRGCWVVDSVLGKS